MGKFVGFNAQVPSELIEDWKDAVVTPSGETMERNMNRVLREDIDRHVAGEVPMVLPGVDLGHEGTRPPKHTFSGDPALWQEWWNLVKEYGAGRLQDDPYDTERPLGHRTYRGLELRRALTADVRAHA